MSIQRLPLPKKKGEFYFGKKQLINSGRTKEGEVTTGVVT